jgi:hypothetical protein
MIEAIFIMFFFSSAVLSGTWFWHKSDNELLARYKRIRRYKAVEAREKEHQKALEAIALRRDLAIKEEATEHGRNMLIEQKKHYEALAQFDSEFKEITREEDEAREEEERKARAQKEREAYNTAQKRRWEEEKRLREERQKVQREMEAYNNTHLQNKVEGAVYLKAIYARINARKEPTLDSPVVFIVSPYQLAPVEGWVNGQLHHGSTKWYRLARTGAYVHSAGFEPTKAFLPDLNSYEYSETLTSMQGPVRTVNGPENNPWSLTVAPTIQSITRGGVTATTINANLITSDKLTVAGGLTAPQETSYDLWKPVESREATLNRAEQEILDEFSVLSDLVSDTTDPEEMQSAVEIMSELTEQMNELREQKLQLAERNKKLTKEREAERRLKESRERSRREEEERRARRRRDEEDDRQRNLNMMNTMNTNNLAMMVATGLI